MTATSPGARRDAYKTAPETDAYQLGYAAGAAAGERLRAAGRETCREEVDGGRCNEPAEFILWGKLFPPEALGPRCYGHAVDHASHSMPPRVDQYAVFDLRPFRLATDAQPEPADRAEGGEDFADELDTHAAEAMRDPDYRLAFRAPGTLGRTSVADAISAWEEKGPTSSTVAAMADALYGTADQPAPVEAPDEREALARVLFVAEQCDRYQARDVEGNWNGRLSDQDRDDYRDMADAVLAAGYRRSPDDLLAEAERGSLHVMRWTYEDGGTRAEAVCLAEPGADCRLAGGPDCNCEWWGRVERRDDGTIWHLLTDGYRDLTLPRDREQWHRVVPQDQCNVCLFINESGVAEELTPEDDGHTEFVLAEVPFEPVWESDGCAWRPILRAAAAEGSGR